MPQQRTVPSSTITQVWDAPAVMATARRLEGRPDAADWVRRLRQAALADAEGNALDDAIKTVESFL